MADAAEPKERKVRAGTKQAMLIEMLLSPDGASIEEIVAATGWQPHTVRGAIAGALKKKLGLDVTSEKVEGRGRVYHCILIQTGAAAHDHASPLLFHLLILPSSEGKGASA